MSEIRRDAKNELDLERLLGAFPLPELTGSRLFVTGCTGFFGYWLLSALACLNRLGQEIKVEALSRAPERFLTRHPEFQSAKWLTFVRGEVESYFFPAGDFDAFIHGATDTSIAAAAHPLKLFNSIAAGTCHVLDHAVTAKARRVLLISSGAIYGAQPPELKNLQEDAQSCGDPTDPGNAYGEGKRVMEMLGACYAREHGIQAVFARCFAFVGPYLPVHLAVGQFIRDAVFNDRIVVAGDGTPVRTYLYAADLAVWLLALLARGRTGLAYNVGSDVEMTLAEAAYRIRDSLSPGKPVDIRGKFTASSRARYVPNVSRAQEHLGVKVWSDFETSARSTAEWHRLKS